MRLVMPPSSPRGSVGSMCADDADVLAVEGEPDGRHRRAAVRHDGSEIGECLLRGDEIEERGNPGNGWRCGMKVYAFDVDHTLELSAGPVRFADVVRLREDGHIVGICGNWGAVTRFVGGWHNLFSFIGPIGSTKADMLVQLATYIPAEEHIMVGNDPSVFGQSADSDTAAQAGWLHSRGGLCRGRPVIVRGQCPRCGARLVARGSGRSAL